MQAALIAWITIRLWTHFLAYNPDLLVLAEVLMRLMSRIIEIFLMIRDALQTRKGKERSQ